MATCTPSPTLTLFTTVTSTIVVTTFSVSVQTLPGVTSTLVSSACLSTLSGSCVVSTVANGITVIPGGVSTISVPLVITSIITQANPISTLFGSCSLSTTRTSSTVVSSTTSQSPPTVTSFTPTTFVVTTTPPPTVLTEETSSTLGNGDITIVTIISTSTPSPSVVTSVGVTSQPPPSQSQGSKSSVALGPIVGGAAGGFICLIGVVLVIWFILGKCRRSSDDDDDDDIVFPYPVTRDRGHAQQLDLSHEPRPYMYGVVGRPTDDVTAMARQSSTSYSGASDGRPDSATSLIGGPSGFTTMSMAGAGDILSSNHATPSKGGEVGRQNSHSSTGHLPPGAAAPTTYLGSSSSGSDSIPGSSRYPLQVANPPSVRSSFPDEIVKKSAPAPLPEEDIIIHMDGGHLPVPNHGLLASSPEVKIPAQPEVSNSDAPPAYVA